MAPPGYQGWHVGKEDASTGETLSCPCLLQQGGDGWYKAEPKSNRAWEGVGWGHSTVDVGDNITPMEGRTPAVGVSKEGKDGRIAESFKLSLANIKTELQCQKPFSKIAFNSLSVAH